MGLCCCSFRRRDLFCGLHVIEGEDHIASQKNKLHCKAYRNPWEKKEAREDAKVTFLSTLHPTFSASLN
jgi:hypothetical protein